MLGAPRRPWIPNPFEVWKRLESSGAGLRGDSVNLGLASCRAANSLEYDPAEALERVKYTPFLFFKFHIS